MTQATLTSKGQITIPKEIRDSLHLSTGDKIDFLLTQNGEAIIRPVAQTAQEVFGLLAKQKRKPVSVEQMDTKVKESFRKKSI